MSTESYTIKCKFWEKYLKSASSVISQFFNSFIFCQSSLKFVSHEQHLNKHGILHTGDVKSKVSPVTVLGEIKGRLKSSKFSLYFQHSCVKLNTNVAEDWWWDTAEKSLLFPSDSTLKCNHTMNSDRPYVIVDPIISLKWFCLCLNLWHYCKIHIHLYASKPQFKLFKEKKN